MNVINFIWNRPFSTALFLQTLFLNTGCDVKLMKRKKLEIQAVDFDEVPKVFEKEESAKVLELYFLNIHKGQICDIVFEKDLFYILFDRGSEKSYRIQQTVKAITDMGFEHANGATPKFPKWIDKKWEDIPWWYFVKA